MRTILLFIIGIMLSIDAYSDNITGGYKVRHFTTTQGLPGNTIRDIRQDADGFLWMAGTGGLARFDGYRFVSFNGFGHGVQRGIPRHIGGLLMSSSKHSLWLSTATYNQACYDLRLGRFVDYTGRGDDEHPYRRIIQARDGVWMSSNTDGVRHVTELDGKYQTVDYTLQNRRLPSNNVRNVVEDGNGIIWVATDKGLVRIDHKGRSRTLLNGKDMMRCNAYGNLVMAYQKDIRTAYIFDTDGRLLRKGVLPLAMGHIAAIRGIMPWQGKWIIFATDAAFAVDMKSGQFSKPQKCQLSNGSVYAHIGSLRFVGNRSGSLWIFPDKGSVRRLDLFVNSTTTRERNSVFSVTRGADGLYYIGSYGSGLFVYNYATGEVSHYTAEDREPVIFSNYVLFITTDSSGCVWVSAENGGVSCLTPATDMAEYHFIDKDKQGDWTNAILRILPSPQKDILRVETKEYKLYDYSLSSSSFEYRGSSKNAVSSTVTDSQGRVWTATRGDGLLLNGRKMGVVADGKPIETIDFTAVACDHNGRIWIGTWGQGVLLVKSIKGNRVNAQRIIANQYNESRVNDIAISKDGSVYVATFNGLYAVSLKSSAKGSYKPQTTLYHLASGNFPTDEVNCICLAPGHIVWVGTVGGGLVRCDFSRGADKMTYKSFTTRDGLSDNNIRSLVYDSKGFLWVGSDNGLSRVDSKDNYIRRYQLNNNVLSNTFSGGSAKLLADGRLAFGTANGLAIVDPTRDHNAVDSIDFAAPLISDISVNGTSIYEGLDSVITDRALVLSPKIKLKHGQNSLTFFFSSCNYREIPSQVYQYYLEGLDHQWRPATGESHAEYSNLSPGNYVFHLRMVTQRGAGKETLLKVHISQPWYNTIWAWLVYLLLAAVIVWYISRNARERLRMHQQMQLEKQLAEFRTNFFTHVTHEFRTPLAILQNAVERIYASGSGSRKDIQTAQRGIRRLLRLVNQFLEYRRIEAGKQRLQLENGDIVTFVHDIFHDFRIMAEQKHITLNFTPFARHFDMYFDHQLVESVVYNLLSNAVKYTPEKGTVSLSIHNDEAQERLNIVVEDTGNGISGSQREELFRPFMDGHVSKGGMGIGLYTSYRMAVLHHGLLSYSDAEPHGACFTFTLPSSQSVYSPDEFAKVSGGAAQAQKDDEHYRVVIREMAPKAINSQRVAIIEDDPDMQDQIVREVGTYFQTSAYSTGKAGLEGIEKEAPSLILCDIMLPDMNGYDVVRKLKEREDLRDIPVIMLTALEDEAHQIKGYQVGADDYMVKPCNYHLLIARMMQLIRWHEERKASAKKVQKHADDAARTVEDAQASVILTSRADKRFKEQVEALVSQHIDDQNLSVDRLAEMLSMGRTKFYGKVKDIFGMSPNKYLLARRMEVAAQLLDEGKYNVSEVSYMVGFSDPAYFNKCFKAHYGMVPSKYKGR